MKTVRAISWCLLLPLMIVLFYLEAKMVLPDYVHSLMQFGIVLVIGSLAWELFWFDEIDRLKGIQSPRPQKDLEPLSSISSRTESHLNSAGYQIGKNVPAERESAEARFN